MELIRRKLYAGSFILLATLVSVEIGAAIILKVAPELEGRVLAPVRVDTSPTPRFLRESLSSMARGNPPVSTPPAEAVKSPWALYWEGKNFLWVPYRSRSLSLPFSEVNSNRLVWETTLTTDARGRRIPTWHNARKRTATSHVMAFGCSVAWGHGVSDDETLVAQMTRHRPDVLPLNGGVPGYGPIEALVRARDFDLLEDIIPGKGIGIYFLISDQVDRFLNNTKVAHWRPHGLVWREGVRGTFESLGTVQMLHPWRVILAKIALVDPLSRLIGWKYPVETEESLDQMFRAIEAIREEYWKKTDRRNRFVVVLMPTIESEAYIRAAKRSDLDFLDYSTVDPSALVPGRASLPGDPHPSADLNAVIGEALARDLLGREKGNRAAKGSVTQNN